MSILFSGDFNANFNNELGLITKNALIKKYGPEKYNAIKYHVILGDAYFMKRGNEKEDKTNYEALARRPFPILCVMGNEDPILGMSERRETDIGIGGTVYQIQDKPFVAYLKRGKVYTIDGVKFLVLGGAQSLDKKRKEPGISWWEEEYWSEEEKTSLFKLLETDNTFDFVISHTGPHTINKILFGFNQLNHFQDEVAFLNDQINGKIKFREWWCAHWYLDKKHFDPAEKKMFRYFYQTTRIIERIDGKLTAYSENELDKNGQGGLYGL